MSQQPPAAAEGNAWMWATAVWSLYLASMFTFALSAPIGLIIAYAKRRDLLGTPYESHMTSAIRTFWISALVGLAALALLVAGFAVPALAVIGGCMTALLVLWQAFRGIRGFMRSIDGQPIANPAGWL
jgi:uncharacterized membrane protein